MHVEFYSELTEELKQDILGLWQGEFPEQIFIADTQAMDQYLAKYEHPRHFLIRNNGRVVAWLYRFIRNNKPWFSMIVSEEYKNSGYGSLLLRHARKDVDELYGWVVPDNANQTIHKKKYRSPVEFYRKNGFTIHEDVFFEANGLSTVKMSWKR